MHMVEKGKRAARRKSIVIVEKDSTQTEIDKTPAKSEELRREVEEEKRVKRERKEKENEERLKKENEERVEKEKERLEQEKEGKERVEPDTEGEERVEHEKEGWDKKETGEKERVDKNKDENFNNEIDKKDTLKNDKEGTVNQTNKNEAMNNVKEGNNNDKEKNINRNETGGGDAAEDEKSTPSKKVKFDESRNAVCDVEKDPEKAISVEPEKTAVERQEKIKSMDKEEGTTKRIYGTTSADEDESTEDVLKRQREVGANGTKENMAEGSNAKNKEVGNENTEIKINETQTINELKQRDEKEQREKQEREIQEHNDRVNSLPMGIISSGELSQRSEILHYRSKNEIVLEGKGRKKRFYCSCFWVERYFVLLKTGHILYFSNKDSKSKFFANLRDVIEVTKINEESNSTYHIELHLPNRILGISFENREVRNLWYDDLKKIIEKHVWGLN